MQILSVEAKKGGLTQMLIERATRASDEADGSMKFRLRSDLTVIVTMIAIMAMIATDT